MLKHCQEFSRADLMVNTPCRSLYHMADLHQLELILNLAPLLNTFEKRPNTSLSHPNNHPNQDKYFQSRSSKAHCCNSIRSKLLTVNFAQFWQNSKANCMHWQPYHVVRGLFLVPGHESIVKVGYHRKHIALFMIRNLVIQVR